MDAELVCVRTVLISGELFVVPIKPNLLPKQIAIFKFYS